MSVNVKRRRELVVAADILDAEIRLVFGDVAREPFDDDDGGLEAEQRLVILIADRSEEAFNECHAMLDDMEARLGIRVDRARELVGKK